MKNTFYCAMRPCAFLLGDALENLTWSPEVTIRGCHFASNRARGVLISTPGRVLVESNRFESSGSAILIAGDANYWHESGAVTEVTIRGNVFEAPCLTSMYQFCEGIISICPEIPKLDPAFPFHRNIRIEDNEFHPFDFPVLYAKSTAGLTFSNNRLIRSRALLPSTAGKPPSPWRRAARSALKVTHSKVTSWAETLPCSRLPRVSWPSVLARAGSGMAHLQVCARQTSDDRPKFMTPDCAQ